MMAIGAAGAQAPASGKPQMDTIAAVPGTASRVRPMHGDGPRVCMDCGGWGPAPGSEPAFIIKDSGARVLAMVPPGDSVYSRGGRHPIPHVDPALIAEIKVVRDTSVRALGPGFGNGIIVITLTPAGSDAYRRELARSARDRKR